MARKLIAVVLLSVGACAAQGAQQTVPTANSESPSTTSPAPPPPAPGCPDLEGFADSGRIALVDQVTSDSTQLGRISWVTEANCETFTFNFLTVEGAPATTPPSIAVDYLPDRSVLRVRIDVDGSTVIDQLVETNLVNRLYVVQAIDGDVFVDLHLVGATQARITHTNSPAGVVVELQHGGDEIGSQPTTSETAVVIEPSDGDQVSNQVNIAGYAPPGLATLHFIATAADQILAQGDVTIPAQEGLWQEFRSVLPIPSGPASLFVGQEDPTDGHLVGVTVNLVVQ